MAIEKEKLEIISEFNKSREKMNAILNVYNDEVFKTVESIVNISTLTHSTSDSVHAFFKFIDVTISNISQLTSKCDEFNNNVHYFNFEEAKLKLDEIEKIIIRLGESRVKVAEIKESQLNVIYKHVELYKLTTVNMPNVDFKKCFFDNLKNSSAQLCLYNESLEHPKGVFSKVYKYLFKDKYLRKKKASYVAFNKLDMLNRNLYHLLQSEDFKNNPIPAWACKLAAKTINECMPMNDIFWRFTEWNKIYKAFIIETERT